MSEEKEFQQRIQQVEGLIRKIENLADPETRASAVSLVQALMEFHGAGLDRMMEMVADAGAPGFQLFDKFGRDGLVSSMLLLYGLHPMALETRVMQALDKVRPYLDSHGGNVELIGIEHDVVRLRMQGSCKSCPSSSMTLKLAIEEAIYEAAPDVVAIEAEGVNEPTAAHGLVQIGAPIGHSANGHGAKSKGWEEVNDLHLLEQSKIATKDISGRSVLFCRLGESLYAYGDKCPGCGNLLAEAKLELTNLICPHCTQQFDLIRAGRGLDQPSLHLEPYPLLVEAGRTKIALPTLSTSSTAPIASTFESAAQAAS